MKAEQIDKISELVTPILQPIEGYLVDLQVRGDGGSSIIEVYVDTDEGITAEQCAEISRVLSVELDALNIIHGRYRLEVSSPGLNRPLKLARQFKKNIGRLFKIVSKVDAETVTIIGVLQEVTDASVTLLTSEKQVVSVKLNDVEDAYVLPLFKKRD